MARKAKPWRCRKCDNINPVRTRKCQKCGKARPKKKLPEHMKALTDYTYEDYIKINGGEFCWICRELGIPDRRTRRLQRDHDHFTGEPRGLLCYQHNKWLAFWITPELLMAAWRYLTKPR